VKELDLNSGALAPVAEELNLDPLRVTGEIPAGLCGIEFAGTTRAPCYRNRWVRTQAWAMHNKVAQPERFPATNPNVNLVNHGAELLALAEGAAPFLIYNVHSKTGEQLHSTPIEVPEPAMMHDMAITQTSSIFLDLNVVYDFSL